MGRAVGSAGKGSDADGRGITGGGGARCGASGRRGGGRGPGRPCLVAWHSWMRVCCSGCARAQTLLRASTAAWGRHMRARGRPQRPSCSPPCESTPSSSSAPLQLPAHGAHLVLRGGGALRAMAKSPSFVQRCCHSLCTVFHHAAALAQVGRGLGQAAGAAKRAQQRPALGRGARAAAREAAGVGGLARAGEGRGREGAGGGGGAAPSAARAPTCVGTPPPPRSPGPGGHCHRRHRGRQADQHQIPVHKGHG